MDKAVRKYLDRYAENRDFSAINQSLAHRVFDHAIVVPCRGEGTNIKALINSISDESTAVLLILVINGSEGDDEEIGQLNKESCNFLRTQFEAISTEAETFNIYDSRFGTIVAINCYDEKNCLSSREGVGLARKIGTDLALFLWTQRRIRSAYIQSTDADVRLPEDLLEQIYSIPRKPKFSALLLPFYHVANPDTADVSRASAIHEMSLRYYVMGLRYAGSPYAHHTIGSTILVHANDYAKARGYPKRLAGEDFHLLNKLRKLRPIYRCSGLPLQVEGRISRRVPFGTGRKIDEIRNQGICFFYAPEIFQALRQFFQRVEQLTQVPVNAADELNFGQGIVIQCLRQLGYLEGIIYALRPEGTQQLRAQRFMTYFDALKTLRTIHLLRDEFFPNVDYEIALRNAPFLDAWTNRGTTIEEARDGLSQFENYYFRTPVDTNS